jgi:nucleoid-associated protein YgaU
MAEIKCPVCGKTGIPDYRVQDTICPQCGADLSIYKLAHDIENASMPSGDKERRRMAWIIPTAIACCLAIALICTALSGSNAKKELKASEKENATLVAQVSELQKAQEQAQAVSSASNAEAETHFVYTVRKGDSFWLISKRLYGTGTRYREIAESNGLTPESRLNVGDKLIIK